MENGFNIVHGRIKSYAHTDGTISFLINYSDDLLGVSASPSHIQEIETIINKQFKVMLEPGLPPKWVGMD